MIKYDDLVDIQNKKNIEIMKEVSRLQQNKRDIENSIDDKIKVVEESNKYIIKELYKALFINLNKDGSFKVNELDLKDEGGIKFINEEFKFAVEILSTKGEDYNIYADIEFGKKGWYEYKNVIFDDSIENLIEQIISFCKNIK